MGQTRTSVSDGLNLSFDRPAGRPRSDLVQVDPATGHVLVPGHEQNRFRTARFRRFLAMVDAVLARQGTCRIIDLGGTPAYWSAFDQDLGARNVSITVINLLPQVSSSDRIICITGDATALVDHASMSFDIVHSNSVIEHVGSWDRMKAFAHEVCRLAPAFFVQTPNRWFPFDPHSRTPFFHWLPVGMRVALLMRRRCGFYPRAACREEALRHVYDADALSRAQLRQLFPEAGIEAERLCGMAKSWMAVWDGLAVTGETR